jgi:2-amino-4-hydroxy-6-hydroxymethyldihydropteridine diphosphokinase
MNLVYLLLGSNEGDKLDWLRKGITLLREKCGEIEKISSIYQTAAWGLEDQDDFYNLVLLLQTALKPGEFLEQTQQIEQELGRQRTLKWGPRTLDIDLLFFNDEVIDLPNLKVPHPFLQQRRFTLAPLAEIAPDFIHPVYRKTVSRLLAECQDTLEARKTPERLVPD